jgi:hypothetical protein
MMKIPAPVKTGLRYATLGGSVLLIGGSAMAIFKHKMTKDSILPTLYVLVGIAAFSYSLMGHEAPVMAPAPKTEEPKDGGTDKA